MAEKQAPVVLLTGQLCTEQMWRDQVPALKVLADVRISVQREHDTIDAMAKAVLDSLPERFSIIAHAMGGFVAFEILRQAPERVASLALLSTLAPKDTPVQTARREG